MVAKQIDSLNVITKEGTWSSD